MNRPRTRATMSDQSQLPVQIQTCWRYLCADISSWIPKIQVAQTRQNTSPRKQRVANVSRYDQETWLKSLQVKPHMNISMSSAIRISTHCRNFEKRCYGSVLGHHVSRTRLLVNCTIPARPATRSVQMRIKDKYTTNAGHHLAREQSVRKPCQTSSGARRGSA